MAATRARIEELWDAGLGDTYGLSDVWGSLAGESEERDGLHFLGQDGVLVELIDPVSGDRPEAEPGVRRELVHLPRPPGRRACSASARGTSPRSSPRSLRADAWASGSASSAAGGAASRPHRGARRREEALRLSLVDLVAEDVEAQARRLAERIAGLARSPSPARSGSSPRAGATRSSAPSTARPPCASGSSRTAEAREGLAAFLEKRQPRFGGR